MPPRRPQNADDLAGYAQRGLPGVLPEAEPLPSEMALNAAGTATVLDGGLLAQRRKEALAQLRGLLVDRHPDVDPDDWRVFVATVAPPYGHLPRAPGTSARAFGVMQAAQDCFPGLSPSAALRRFREVQQSPTVRGLVADFRALELADLHEQRGMVREFLHGVLSRGMKGALDLDPSVAPNEWARVSQTVVAACKVLVDMDGLALKPEQVADATATAADDDAPADQAALLQRVAAVAEDVRRRKVAAGA